ncbi:MAG: capsular polysaccharide biosynthesis protein CapF [Lachnospiraceae bacterium]|nr:capsular polysaccharide biosynthesis protein CapF [Lachnospiraceae bacterium]
MKILVTGALGFIGKNLISELRNRGYEDIYEVDIDTSDDDLEKYTKDCEFVFHLAGVNRPETEEEFMKGNFGFTSTLLSLLEKAGNKAPVLITSSTQAKLDNAYGKSKKAGEDLMFSYGEKTGAKVYVYRLTNVFGKWSRPNYNSAVATFCNNIAAGLPIKVNDPSVVMKLIYIDDVVDEFIGALNGKANIVDGFGIVSVEHTVELGKIADIIYSFKKSRENFEVPDISNEFEKKLYSTYLSFLPKDDFAYNLDIKADDRGSFTEFLRTDDKGQVSVNVAKPGITKGNHWHHTKNEKFLVVSGEAVIAFRKYGEDEVIEYRVNGSEMKVVDIPCGYIHNIQNVGNTDLVTVMWANEAFNPDKPDTYFEKV